jgi:hypothetical protein
MERQDQKIAAVGNSCRSTHDHAFVGAAEGCDLLILPIKKASRRRPLFVTPLAQALPDQQL